MGKYVEKRLIATIPVLLVVAIVSFLIVHIIPGNPAKVMLGQEATGEQVRHLEEQMGLNDPLYLQFFSWMGNLLRGDFGQSITSGQPVLLEIINHLGPTLSLTMISMTIALIIAIPLATISVLKNHTMVDAIAMTVSLVGVSIPVFWLALLLILFLGVIVHVFPVAGYTPITQGIGSWLYHLILPSFILACVEMGIISRMFRDSMLEKSHEDYVRMARSKGLSNIRVIFNHIYKNAFIPTITVIGNSFANLLGGAVVIETIFTIPGIGQLLINSINHRDYPMIQGIIIIVSLFYVLINLLIDLIYGLLDARIHYD